MTSSLKAVFCLTLVGLVSLLASCNGSFLPNLRDRLRNPFESVDDVALTKSIIIANTEKHRIVPSTAAIGKKQLTLEECRRLALANSLELRQGEVEVLTQKAIEYSNRTKMLPHFTYNGEVSARDAMSFSYSEFYPYWNTSGPYPDAFFRGAIPNKQRPAASDPNKANLSRWAAGADLRVNRHILEMRWGPYDIILAYYMTKKQQERRKKGALSQGADSAKTDWRRGFFLLSPAFPPENGPNGPETGVNPQTGRVKDAEPLQRKTHFN